MGHVLSLVGALLFFSAGTHCMNFRKTKSKLAVLIAILEAIAAFYVTLARYPTNPRATAY